MKLLIGGSPCTHWSIAQTKNRETEASGIGWELFLNYRIARDKYQPDYFLYENNKSMSSAIRAQITAELGVEPVLINSALVSAQNRQRLYWAGKRNPDGTYSQVPVELPAGHPASGHFGDWLPAARERLRASNRTRRYGGRRYCTQTAERRGGACCH